MAAARGRKGWGGVGDTMLVVVSQVTRKGENNRVLTNVKASEPAAGRAELLGSRTTVIYRKETVCYQQKLSFISIEKL